MISRGAVRYGVAIGSATAVLLLAAGGALVFRGSAPPSGSALQPAAVGQSELTPPAAALTGGDQAPHAPVPVAPSFDVVKISPAGTAERAVDRRRRTRQGRPGRAFRPRRAGSDRPNLSRQRGARHCDSR